MPFKNTPSKVPRDAALQEILDNIGIAELARRVDPTLSKQSVYAWPRVPERWLARVAKVTRFSKHQLRPDLYARNGRRLQQPRGG
jgi:hypothetical protein